MWTLLKNDSFIGKARMRKNQEISKVAHSHPGLPLLFYFCTKKLHSILSPSSLFPLL